MGPAGGAPSAAREAPRLSAGAPRSGARRGRSGRCRGGAAVTGGCGPCGRPRGAEPSIETSRCRARSVAGKTGGGRRPAVAGTVSASASRSCRRARSLLGRRWSAAVHLSTKSDWKSVRSAAAGGDQLLLDRGLASSSGCVVSGVILGHLEDVPAAVGLERARRSRPRRRRTPAPRAAGRPGPRRPRAGRRGPWRPGPASTSCDLLPALRVGVVGFESPAWPCRASAPGRVQDDPDVAVCGLLEAVDVDFVVLLDLVVGDGRLGRLLAELELRSSSRALSSTSCRSGWSLAGDRLSREPRLSMNSGTPSPTNSVLMSQLGVDRPR